MIHSGPGLSEGPCVAGRWILFIGPRRTVLVIRSGVGRAELQPGRTALVIRSGGGRAVLQSGQTVLGEGEARSLGSQILRPWKGRIRNKAGNGGRAVIQLGQTVLVIGLGKWTGQLNTGRTVLGEQGQGTNRVSSRGPDRAREASSLKKPAKGQDPGRTHPRTHRSISRKFI